MTKRLTIALVALAMFVLVAAMPVSATAVPGPYYRVAPGINQGATVFIGEQGLNITNAMNSANDAGTPTDITTIGWWASAADIRRTSPTWTVDTTDRWDAFTVTQSEFEGYDGEWYLVDQADHNFAKNGTGAVFNVKIPKLDISIRDYSVGQNGADVSGKSIPVGAILRFRIGTNMASAINNPDLRYEVFGTPAGDGYLNILVKPAVGTTLISLYDLAEDPQTIRMLDVRTQPWTWGVTNGDYEWDTAALTPAGERAYPAGTYTVSVESKLNNMQGNYLSGGAAYTGRTVSEVRTITLVSDTVSITVNKDSVVRSKPFSVTITGKPSTDYYVWVKSTIGMDLGAYNNAPPVVSKFQLNVRDGNTVAFEYEYQNGAHKTIGENSAFTQEGCDSALPVGDPDCYYSYANVTTNSAGVSTVGFDTSRNTKAQKYTIRVERNNNWDVAEPYENGDWKGDEVDVKVEKGAVTIVAAGDQSYYLGEEVKFSGTNTESATTFLFIIGPNLAVDGAKLTSPREEVTNGDPDDFVQADVLADNTWSYKWGTSMVPLDAGTYTIYAVSQPVDRAQTHATGEPSIGNAAYGTVSIIIKKPFVSATASQSTVAKGDRVYLTGTAEGQPAEGVAIWIMGKNYAYYNTEQVGSDASFKFEIKQGDTRGLTSGQYFIVVQHPMANDQFDIILKDRDWADVGTGRLAGEDDIFVVNAITASEFDDGFLFLINGPGSLQGSDAAEALVQAINSPNVDDTYAKLQFLVEEPTIIIDPVGDKHVGDTFTITAQTNLAVDDEVLMQVYSSSFKPTQKTQSGEFSGATGTLKVTKGDSGMNKLSFPVNAATFKPDEYIVTADAVIQDATGTALFNVLEGAAPTAKPTVVVTTAAPTTVATPVPTTVPPTPTPTKSPGYGALIALIGLGAVAFIVVRRH